MGPHQLNHARKSSDVFFPRVVKIRQAKNSILRVIDVNRTQVTSMQEMKMRVVHYYTNLLACETHSPPIPNLNIQFDDAISQKIREWMRRYHKMEEIKETLFKMPKVKEPGQSHYRNSYASLECNQWGLPSNIFTFFRNRQMLSL